jgi:hypothetical protein
MAYQIDFTASFYASRQRRKVFLRLLLVAALAGAIWEVRNIYTTYNEPTLNMRLAEYELVSRPVEEMNAAWDRAETEYNSLKRYYRLLWASSPTNFISAMATDGSPRLGRGFRPVSWTLATGGQCRLEYLYEFNAGDKAMQAGELEAEVVNAVTSATKVVDGKIDVRGIRDENLLNVDKLNISAEFSLADVKSFPTKEGVLANCVKDIAAMRNRVQDFKMPNSGDAKSVPSNAKGIMMAYLAIGKDKPDFPGLAPVINVAGWFDRADQFIVKNNIPGDHAERRKLKEAWNRIGNARFPWHRFRELDNEDLVDRTKRLESVSDGVKRFKGFLEQRHSDCLRKLEPFVDAYDRKDIYNKPLVESDLVDRVAKMAGVLGAHVAFKDEPDVKPAVLDKSDERFTFTWVRWTLSAFSQSKDGDPGNVLTLGKVSDMANRLIALGPGYALDKVRISFGDDGSVSAAVLEGLLPVKRVESMKEDSKNVN